MTTQQDQQKKVQDLLGPTCLSGQFFCFVFAYEKPRRSKPSHCFCAQFRNKLMLSCRNNYYMWQRSIGGVGGASSLEASMPLVLAREVAIFNDDFGRSILGGDVRCFCSRHIIRHRHTHKFSGEKEEGDSPGASFQ